MEGGLSSIQVLDLRSMHMGGSLHMRGGAPGGHSAIFMEDTKKRKAAGGGDQRSVDEILQGAMLREKRRKVGGWESLSLSELKVKLKELGVEQRKIAACFERSQRLCHALAPCPPLSIACVLFSIHAQTHQSVNYLVVSSAQPAMFIARCALLLGRRQQQQQEGFGTEEEESGHPAFLRQHFEQGEAIFWQGMLKAIVDLPAVEELLRGAVDSVGGGKDSGDARSDGDGDGDGVAYEGEDEGGLPDRAASEKCAREEIQEARDLRLAAQSLPPGVLDGIVEEDEGVVRAPPQLV